MRAALLASCLFWTASVAHAAQKPLEIFFIDVEGGQATLFITPAGQSLLVDTGWPGNAYRDANRILAAAKMGKIKKIDFLLITHYHSDHVGGVPQLAAKIPIGTFIDHGPNREDSRATNRVYADYQKAVVSANHLTPKPGDQLPIKGIDAVVVSADGNSINQPLPNAGQPNNSCADVKPQAADPSENARSLGVVITLDKLKIVDLGDLTWNKELELVCPSNKIGKADIFVVSHHGSDSSDSPALVHGIRPRVAIMDNSATKGGSPLAWDIIKSSPGLEDFWQLHFADAGGKDHNASDPFIANVTEADTGYYLRVVANADGSFEIYNPRNKFSKQYPAKQKP